MRHARASVIINPISGTGGRADVARQRLALAASLVSEHGFEATVTLTERAGHARELADAALAAGCTLVIGWGGDGTANEIASRLAFRGDVSFGLIPSGSGNGLARELRIPLEPRAAFAVACEGHDRVIDAGELDGRLFFNLAGVGLDARVAHEFAAHGLMKRGFLRYIEIAARELCASRSDEHTIVVDGHPTRMRTLLVAIANGRQYGNGALIAPDALIDDGRLDVVIVGARSPWAAFLQAPMLFAGKVAMLPGVTMTRGSEVEITSALPVLYHVDGEPFVGGAVIKGRVHPRALRVRVPAL